MKTLETNKATELEEKIAQLTNQAKHNFNMEKQEELMSRIKEYSSEYKTITGNYYKSN